MGDSIPSANIYTGGVLTNSGHDIRFTIPCNIITDATPKLNIIGLQVRGNGTYLLTDVSNVQISYTYYERLGFTITVQKDDAYAGSINNVPVSVECSYNINFV